MLNGLGEGKAPKSTPSKCDIICTYTLRWLEKVCSFTLRPLLPPLLSNTHANANYKMMAFCHIAIEIQIHQMSAMR